MSIRIINRGITCAQKSMMNNPEKLPLAVRRHFMKDTPKRSQKTRNMIEAKELRFPLPYGQLAAKEWGNPDGMPVLAVHGWLDNAGSFDPLIPHILQPHNLHIIAIDEPGVGFSSHKPVGSEYNRWSTLVDMKRVVDYMKWDKFTLIGHSQGGHFSLIFAAAFPNLVERLICIDIFKPLTYTGDNWVHKVPKILDLHMKYEESFSDDPSKNTKVPVYSEPDAVKRMMEAHGSSLNEESARILMKRGTRQQKWGITFSRDVRIKVPSPDPPPNDSIMCKYLSNLSSDLLIIRAKGGPYHAPDHIRKKYYDIYERHCGLFRDHYVDGTHHLHMNQPENVAPLINQFITDSIASRTKPKL